MVTVYILFYIHNKTLKMRTKTVRMNLIVNVAFFHSVVNAVFTIDIKSHHIPPQRRQSPDAAPQQVQRPTIAVLVVVFRIRSLSRDSSIDNGTHNLHLKLEQYLKITTLAPLWGLSFYIGPRGLPRFQL